MKSNLLSLVFFFTVSSLFFLFLLVNPATIGISYDWQTPVSNITFSKFPITSSWHDGPILPNNSFYLNLFFLALFSVGISNVWATILLVIGGVAIAGYTCFMLIRELTGRHWPALASGLVYMASADLFLKLYFGWLDYLIAYALTPLVLLLFLRFLKHRDVTTAGVGGLIFSVVTSGQPQFLVVLLILLVSYTVWQGHLWRRALTALAIFLLVYFLTSFWWLGAYLGDVTGSLAAAKSNLSVAYQGFQHNSMLDIFQLPFVVWSIKEYLTTLHLSTLSYLWLVASIVTFAIPFFIYALRKDTGSGVGRASFIVHFTILFIGLSLVKGTAQPFSTLGILFYKIPVLSSLFRNINHLYYLVPFSLSALIGLSFSVGFHRELTKRKRHLTRGLAIAFVAILLTPFVLNVYQSRFHTYQLDNESYKSILTKYRFPERDGRLLWLPFGLFVKYYDNQDKETGVTYTGVNPLINSVSPHQLIDSTEARGTPTLLTQLIAYGYCDRIQFCPEKIIGLQTVGDIIHLTRDFQSATPIVNDKQYYRDANWYSTPTVSNWLDGLKKAKKTYEDDALEVYTLDAEMISPHVYVPTSIDAVLAQRGALFHGVTINRDRLAAFLVNPDEVSDVTRMIIPLDFTEDTIDRFTHNNYQLFTSLDVPEDGNYYLNFYQKRKSTTSPLTLFTIKKIDYSARSIELDKVDRIPDVDRAEPLVKSGFIYLTKGHYTVIFSNSVNNNNSIFNPSFEYGFWSGAAYNCNSNPDDLAVTREIDRPHVLKIKNRVEEACLTVVVGNLEPNQKYLFSYDIKHTRGAQPAICLATTEDGYCRGLNDQVPSGVWQHQEFIYEQGDSDRAIVTIRVPAGGEVSENSIDNFELRQVALPETLAFVKDEGTISGSAKLVEYRKISDAKYRVILRGASGVVPLVLGEQFDHRWRAYIVRMESALPEFTGPAFQSSPSNGVIQNNNLSLGDLWETNGKFVISQHQAVNGDMNLWHIPVYDSERDVEIILEYGPQKIMVVGQPMALITVIVIIGSAIVAIVKRRRGALGSS